jgi:hypothetical protein
MAAVAAWAAGPQRDLTVEIRQVEEGRDAAGSYRASTRSEAAPMGVHKIQVRNGQKGAIRFNQAVPMQWVQSVQQATSNSGAGKSIVVQPTWPGGNKPAVVDIEVSSSGMQTEVNADLPRQNRSETTSTVTAPLGEWVTFATSGAEQPAGTYSSDAPTQTRQLLQIRVLVP